MSLNPTAAIWHQHTEEALRNSITQGEYPYLGLYRASFTTKMREFLDKQARLKSKPVNEYIHALRKWPAIYACYLTLHVAENYGDETVRGVYPAIGFAISGTRQELSTHDREALWLAYRQACLKLGLAVSSRQSGTNYMVNEYLQQSGVPVNYVEDLVKRMIRYAKKVGLPSDDNPQAIQQWMSAFAERLKTPVSITVRNAIENDEHGFYLRLFLRLIDSPELSASESELETIMAKTITDFGAEQLSNVGQLSLPRLLWLDNGFALELPAGESSIWTVQLDDESISQVGKYELQLIPLQRTDYKAINLSDEAKNTYSFNLWPDHKDNRLLVFSEQGEFITQAQLSAESNVLALAPGHYQFVSRFRPKGLDAEIECLAEGPDLYGLEVDLRPEQKLSLQRGHASLLVQADAKPYVGLIGQSYHDTKGHEIYASAGLKLGVSLPAEYLKQTESGYVVRLVPGDSGEACEITINPADSGLVELALSTQAKQWKAGLTRLLIELKRGDIARPIARLSVLFWNGLVSVKNANQFYCDRLPENLLSAESDNSATYEKYVSYKDAHQRSFGLCFQLSEHKKISLAWFVQGVFISLKDYSNGQYSERILQKNTPLTVNNASRALLEVFSSTPGVLQLGRFSKNIGVKNKTLRLHLSSLVEYLTPESHILQFTAHGSLVAEPLLNLMTSNELLSFRVSRVDDFQLVAMSLSHVVSVFRLTAVDQLTGQCVSVELVPDDVSNLHNASRLANVTSSTEGDIRHYLLECPISNWSSGAWVITLEVKVNNRWGFLCNARQDHYAFGLLVNASGHSLLPSDIEALLSFLSNSELLPVLRRVHLALLICYAQESWDEIAWLKSLWLYLVHRLKPQTGELLLESLHLAAQYPPDTASSGWVPILSLGATIPWIFSCSADAYKGFEHRRENLLLAFKVFEPLNDGVASLLRQGLLNGILAFSFANLQAVMQGSEPRGFDMGTYRDALVCEDISSKVSVIYQDDWQPRACEFLGALHYQWAVKTFKDHYLRTSKGNDFRRITALGLIKNCTRLSIDKLCSEVLPDSFQAYSLGLLDALSDDDIDLLSDEAAQQRENYLAMIQFLAVFAQVCRHEVRSPGVLKLFINELSAQVANGLNELQGVLGYLLFVGEDIFAFYLLLWEIVFQADMD
ncbi:hypothetical protein AU255_09030 [Methyloprofundus sedimenti]|uniref:Uncharacterized protein n=2 Tax=Methyloprofundus sedimenti TaxID=1420851 RepID=A0A1V8M909_9GAMM|nr:hypothetical protein AU255_09030 [Methyloprofundus sedimenti]